MRLSGYAVGRDNNFNLIRLMAALSVIFSHSVAALGLPSSREFFFDHLGLSLAEMAVDVFFVTSGFLVTGSLVNRGDVIAYLWARALRIYPAMWAMLVITVLALAPALTTLPLADYFASPKMHEYFVKCATLIGGVRYSLPGVFETNPLHGEFNGSLWTLPIEMRLYCYLAAGWLVLAAAPAIRLKAMSLALPIAAAAFLFVILRGRLLGTPFNVADTRVFMFLYGSTLYLWRDRVPVSPAILAGALALLLATSFDKAAFFAAYVFCLAPAGPPSGLPAEGTRPRLQRLGGLFLWRLHLRVPDPADAGLPLSRHAAHPDDRRLRRDHSRRRVAVLDPDRKAGAGAQGRPRRGDVAGLQSRLGQDRRRRALTGGAKSQADSKSSKIQPSQPDIQPNFSKENPLISLDSLVRIEPFQWVILTPWPKNLFLSQSPLWCARAGAWKMASASGGRIVSLRNHEGRSYPTFRFSERNCRKIFSLAPGSRRRRSALDPDGEEERTCEARIALYSPFI